jgi:hypothetical protein
MDLFAFRWPKSTKAVEKHLSVTNQKTFVLNTATSRRFLTSNWQETVMKVQIQNNLKLAAILFATATVCLAQATLSPPVTSRPASGAAGYGQPSQKLAVPGTINYVEGQAMLGDQPLEPGAAGYTVAQPNQTLETQAGFVEVLLTPGAFLRVGHNSELVMQSLGLANLQLQVVHGSAMVEVADLVKGTIMQVNMNGATMQVEKQGLYEFDADQQLVRMLDGKVKVLEASTVRTIGKGDQIVLKNAKLKPHSFDKQVAEADPLYVWSKARSAAEAQANVSTATYVASNGGWYGPGWYWNPFWAQYAFLPGAGFLYSPFGWGFYGRGYYRHVPGVSASVHGYVGGFHSGFAGGFHGGGHR